MYAPDDVLAMTCLAPTIRSSLSELVGFAFPVQARIVGCALARVDGLSNNDYNAVTGASVALPSPNVKLYVAIGFAKQAPLIPLHWVRSCSKLCQSAPRRAACRSIKKPAPEFMLRQLLGVRLMVCCDMSGEQLPRFAS